MSRSWEAVDEASKLQNSNLQDNVQEDNVQEDNVQEYNRLINAIAGDLEKQGLFYEVARLKTRIGIPFPQDYPFSKSLKKNPDWLKDPNLVSLLYKLATDKIITKVPDKKRGLK
jgi:hypothetical protein